MSRRSLYNKRRAHQASIYGDLPAESRRVRTADFGAWIKSQGGWPLPTTNIYEVMRYKRPSGTVCIAYKNAQDDMTWTLQSGTDYRAFQNGDIPTWEHESIKVEQELEA